MFVYAAIYETNKPTASEDLRTEKEAFPDDAGKVVVNDMSLYNHDLNVMKHCTTLLHKMILKYY